MARKSSSKKASPQKGSRRSAITGRYVTAKYGKSHPKTTIKHSK